MKKYPEILEEILIENVKSGDIIGINHKTYLYMLYKGKHKLIPVRADECYEYNDEQIDKVFNAKNGKCILCRKDLMI